MSTTLLDLELDKLGPHPDNVRKHLGDLTELAKSIEGTGILEPLLVLPAGGDGIHLVVAGHRRLAAAAKAKLTTAPCVIRDLTPAEVVEAMLVENLQRAEISAVEEALAYARLVELGTTATQIAKKVGRTANHVKGRLALTALPAELLTMLEDGKLTLAQAGEIAAHADDPDAIAWVTKDIKGRDAHSLSWTRFGSKIEGYITRRDQAAAIGAEADKLAKSGLTLFEPKIGWWMPDSLRLDRPCKVAHLELVAADRKAHAKEPCHQVLLELKPDTGPDYKVTRTPMCVDPRRHTLAGDEADRSALQIPTPDPDAAGPAMPGDHLGGGAGAAERAAEFAAAEQRAKARTDAETARRDFTRTHVATAPSGMPDLMARVVLNGIADGWGPYEFAAIVGITTDDARIEEIFESALNSDTAAERDPWIWAWTFSLAENGERFPGKNGLFVAYLRYLESLGYELSDYEAGFIAEHEASLVEPPPPDIDAMELGEDTTEILASWGGLLSTSTSPTTWAAGADTVPAHVLEDLQLRELAEFIRSDNGGVGIVRPTDAGRAVAKALETC